VKAPQASQGALMIKQERSCRVELHESRIVAGFGLVLMLSVMVCFEARALSEQ
jgi:hypothetical protein